MRRFSFVFMVGFIVLLGVLRSVLPAGARAPVVCGPRDNPSGCEPLFDTNQELAIRTGVSFVWLRKDPSSSAEIAATVNYSPSASLTVIKWPSSFDGYQNWWLVGSLSDKSKTGWVEQGSLVAVSAPEPTAPKANWSTNFAGGIRAGVPFVWVRNAPDSSAGVLYTLIPGDPFIVLVDPQPIYDGRQWWWMVTSPVPTSAKSGYVEQVSLVPREGSSPTLVPSLVPTLYPSLVPTNVADTPRPTCGTMTVSPATYRAPDAPNGSAIYYVTPGSYITFRVEGLANLASITFNVPGSNYTIWRNGTEPRQLDFPGEKAEVYLTVPQAYGWASVSAEAVGLNGETIQCGAFWIDNGNGALGVTATPEGASSPATTPETTG